RALGAVPTSLRSSAFICGFNSGSEMHSHSLQPTAFRPLPLGAVRPLGWLRDQLRLQADGLTGHLEEFWPDLGPDNMWLDVAREVARQGSDWRGHFETFLHTGKTPRDRCTLATHVVNNAMAVKAGGVAWRQSGDPRDRASVYRTLAALDAYHGQATGVFSG